MWACYCISTNQLNLYHAGRAVDHSCRKVELCHGCKETASHIFWDCSTARACWSLLIRHSSGTGAGEVELTAHFRQCANRRASSQPHRLRELLIHRFQDDHQAAGEEFRRIWFVLYSICQVHLWVERNAAVFRGKLLYTVGSASAFWESRLRQLKAIALREHRSAVTAVSEMRLLACIELLR